MAAKKPDDLAQQVAAAVQQQLGGDDPQIRRLIEEELGATLRSPPHSPAPSTIQTAATNLESTSRIVVTAHGRNRTGVVARLASAIDEFSGDIRDLSQTIVGDYFTMLFVVDIADAPEQGARFTHLRSRLQDVGKDMGVHVVAMHDDILSTMHTI